MVLLNQIFKSINSIQFNWTVVQTSASSDIISVLFLFTYSCILHPLNKSENLFGELTKLRLVVRQEKQKLSKVAPL